MLTLSRLAMPMALGLFFMIMVHIIETYWIGQLGTDELAAMTFTFPVVGIVSNIAFGIMIGTSTAVARQLGQGKRAEAKLITTHALYLGVFLVILVSVVGVYAQGAIFRALGASEELIPIVKRYMTIWFLGVVFLMIPSLPMELTCGRRCEDTHVRDAYCAIRMRYLIPCSFMAGDRCPRWDWKEPRTQP